MMARIEQQVSLPLLDSEKQDVCHLATMLMEVGMTLAQRTDENGKNGNGKDDGHGVKKKKRS